MRVPLPIYRLYERSFCDELLMFFCFFVFVKAYSKNSMYHFQCQSLASVKYMYSLQQLLNYLFLYLLLLVCCVFIYVVYNASKIHNHALHLKCRSQESLLRHPRVTPKVSTCDYSEM